MNATKMENKAATRQGLRMAIVLIGTLLNAAAVLGAQWHGESEPFRADTRAGTAAVLPLDGTPWAVWDTAWDGAESVEVALERPGGAVEILGRATGRRHGMAVWRAGEGEYGRFSLTLISRDSQGTVLKRTSAVFAKVLPLAVATESLPAAWQDREYSVALEATGGLAPFAWLLVPEDGAENGGAGGLPEGYSLTSVGILDGTTSLAGEYAFSVQVVDSLGMVASRPLVLVVRNPEDWAMEAPVPVPHAWLEDKAGDILSEVGGDWNAAAKGTAVNGRKVWECYVAGLDPGKEEDFRVTMVQEGGEWGAHPEPFREGARRYVVEGASSFGDGASWGPVTPESRFFRARVLLTE